MIEAIPQNYGTKYTQFFSALGDLAKWSDEQRAAYHKAHIAPKIISDFIYSRFLPDVKIHLEEKNPYIKWCTRKHKHICF